MAGDNIRLTVPRLRRIGVGHFSGRQPRRGWKLRYLCAGQLRESIAADAVTRLVDHPGSRAAPVGRHFAHRRIPGLSHVVQDRADLNSDSRPHGQSPPQYSIRLRLRRREIRDREGMNEFSAESRPFTSISGFFRPLSCRQGTSDACQFGAIGPVTICEHRHPGCH
jgi:hypothetical protein